MQVKSGRSLEQVEPQVVGAERVRGGAARGACQRGGGPAGGRGALRHHHGRHVAQRTVRAPARLLRQTRDLQLVLRTHNIFLKMCYIFLQHVL